MDKKYVTIFGSSLPKAGEPEYDDAERLGALLAKAGLHVVTGGNQGVMDAVSKGAALHGAEAVGITVSIFPSPPSVYLTENIRCSTLAERLEKLIAMGSAYIVLQGGTGTLLELALVWEYMNKGLMAVKPVAAHSPLWRAVIEPMEQQIIKEGRAAGLVVPFGTVEGCARYICSSLGVPCPELQ